MIAILSYHGWETSPQQLADDIQTLRGQGRKDISLEHLEKLIKTNKTDSGRFFHITSDDGGEGDRAIADTLQSLSAPATFFICLNHLNTNLKSFYKTLIDKENIRVEDHSLNHNRTFHFRHIIGFHSSRNPLMSSPEQFGLKSGSPVCMYGGEFISPTFTPDQEAVASCESFAKSISENEKWNSTIADHLIQSRKGFYRLGKLCIQGSYETRKEYEERVSHTLSEGHLQFKNFAGHAPAAFAHPWWKSSSFAEHCLQDLGYRMTFSGNGLCSHTNPFQIPRIFINPQTPRPLELEKLASSSTPSLLSKIKEAIHPILYA